ncbi:hypothetical protein ACH4XT_35865, partial [Streptomyces avidinii]|uniref:hypothetical protein n=1 Tax=Streptomyces avidinii TaxID=1895 RepID=UPI00379CDA3F
IGGPAKNIYAGGAGLFATNPDTGHIYQYGGTPNHWTEIGGPGATFASGHDRLYAIAPDHSAVYEWTGNGTDWTRIGGPAKNIYAGGAGLFATNPDTGHIYQYGGTPDRWTEIGGPGATFTVSDTQLYGLTPDRSATYRWDGKANWTRIGGPENTAQREADERLLRENCQPVGRDCVKELRDAEKILETSLTDWLKDNSLDFLLDTFSINDIRKCAADTDLNSCLTVLLDAGSVILGIGALKKAKNTFNKAKGLHEFADKAKKARDTYNDLRKIINTARKAKEKLPKEEEQQRQEPCPVSKGSTSATASAYTAVAMRSTPATSAAPSHASVKRWTALDTIAHDSVADLQTYHALAGATPALVHNCDVGTQVEHGSTELSRATVIGRLLDNNRSNLYGAARMNDGTIITAHSDDAGHAEEHILSIAQSRGYSPTDITDMYTEYGMCPRCQGQGPQGGSRGVLPQLSGTVNLTYSIPFANPASRPAAKKALASIVRGIFSG